MIITPRFVRLALACGCGVIFATPRTLAQAPAEESTPDAAIVELRETISKLVDVKSMSSAETSEWVARQASMAELLGLHRRELALLDQELAASGTSAGGYDEKLRALETQVAVLKSAKSGLSEAVARHRSRVLTLAERLPDPLITEAATELEILNAWEPGDEARDGLQAILGLVSKAEAFNRRITRVTEVQGDREVQVIYLGLAAAYYADRKGGAGTGFPAPDGWKWSERPSLNPEIRKALDQLDTKRPPELVKLPLQIREAGQ